MGAVRKAGLLLARGENAVCAFNNLTGGEGTDADVKFLGGLFSPKFFFSRELDVKALEAHFGSVFCGSGHERAC